MPSRRGARRVSAPRPRPALHARAAFRPASRTAARGRRGGTGQDSAASGRSLAADSCPDRIRNPQSRESARRWLHRTTCPRTRAPYRLARRWRHPRPERRTEPPCSAPAASTGPGVAVTSTRRERAERRGPLRRRTACDERVGRHVLRIRGRQRARLDAVRVARRRRAPNDYTVVRGDTLWDISDALPGPTRGCGRRSGSYNPQIADPHLIYPGDVGSRSSTSTADPRPETRSRRASGTRCSPASQPSRRGRPRDAPLPAHPQRVARRRRADDFGRGDQPLPGATRAWSPSRRSRTLRTSSATYERTADQRDRPAGSTCAATSVAGRRATASTAAAKALRDPLERRAARSRDHARGRREAAERRRSLDARRSPATSSRRSPATSCCRPSGRRDGRHSLRAAPARDRAARAASSRWSTRSARAGRGQVVVLNVGERAGIARSATCSRSRRAAAQRDRRAAGAAATSAWRCRTSAPAWSWCSRPSTR